LTFIREWTDPESSMHSGLRKARLDAERAASETNDRNDERFPSSEANSSARVNSVLSEKKGGHQSHFFGKMPPSFWLGSELSHG
jgi:hypothetical protein